ncbi:MAG TPA: hypothetical protein PLU52_04150 [Opitutaceae bacterium]|nr:hypothetical protein [Opitutaceae bacterium]HND61336.1 hypothetical protein [Opitutaceae bacterium]
MNLPPELVSLLTDEAYAVLCQQSLSEALTQVTKEKETIISTRPPFGVLASSTTRTSYQTQLRSAQDSEAGLRERLEKLAQVEAWLKHDIEKTLRGFMPKVSGDFRTCEEAAAVVTRWETATQGLKELAQALARDARAVAAAINPMPLPSGLPPTAAAIEQSKLAAIANLRITVVAIQSAVADVLEVRAQFTQLCDEQADGLQLPLPPDFRTVAWVDQLALLGNGAATAEAVRCESEARNFCGDGLKAYVTQANDVRDACHDASQAILAQYWRQLRVHAMTHFIRERDVDEVLTELAQHRVAAEVKRRQASFEAAAFAPLR